MKTEFEIDMDSLRQNFAAQITVMRAFGSENDTLINALAYAASTYALVETHVMLSYEGCVRYWPDWMNKLADLYTEYCATIYAIVRDTPHLRVLVRNLKEAAVTFDELQRYGRNIADWQGDHRIVIVNLDMDEVPAA